MANIGRRYPAEYRMRLVGLVRAGRSWPGSLRRAGSGLPG